jgi:hypothetical protein
MALLLVGGDKGQEEEKLTTLGSILREYNPIIKGLSTGEGSIESEGAGFNLAVTGAVIQGI